MTEQLVKTPLWEHQLEDLAKLSTQEAVLQGSEMGAGKTLFAIERDLRLRAIDSSLKKTLVVSPLNTLDEEGWLGRFTYETDLRVCLIDPKNRSAFAKTDADVYLMHPQALRLMPELRDMGFDHIIADECHAFKNRNAAMTKALKKIKVPYKTAMSGSPATDRPQDLWSILNWLKPKVYTSYWKFYKQAVEFEIVYPGGFHKTLGPTRWWETSGLREIDPFYVRHLKDDCMDLPDKTERKVYVDLDPKQRRAYDQMNEEMIAWVGEHENEPLVAPAVISKLQRLQMLALAYMDYNEDTGKWIMTDPSTKLDAAMDIIETFEDESFVVFSQFKAPLKMLGNRLDAKGIKYGSYTGDDSRDVRLTTKSDFIGGRSRVFLSTIKAGGVGVDGLQHVCSNGIFLDRDWSPMINKQAEDRLHRGGQQRHVHIIDIMARDTVDLGRAQRLEQKWDWIKRLLGDTKRSQTNS